MATKRKKPESASPILTKSELVARIAQEQSQLLSRDVEQAVNSILERITLALTEGERVEIRGFGSLTLRYRPSRTGRNPKTGEKIWVAEKYAPYFKPGGDLRKRIDFDSAVDD